MTALEFDILSGGRVRIDLEKCSCCLSKACISACNTPGMGQILQLENGLPSLKTTAVQPETGACTECLACELVCQLEGEGAITILLPQPELEEYLQTVEEKAVYEEE